ncbi:MAG: DUF1194 domain-containing protein [Rhizobium sp.]|nr:DUF1194 domain-containing protein [Rhizobium sp.]
MGIADFSLKTAGALVAALSFGFQTHATSIDEAQTFDVDVAIVFAVDFSSSIDPDTADLQRNGHVAALSSPEFIDAISSNRRSRLLTQCREPWGSGSSVSFCPSSLYLSSTIMR